MAKNQGGSEGLRAPSLRMDYKQKMQTYLEKGAQLTKGVQKDVETYLKLLNEGVTIWDGKLSIRSFKKRPLRLVLVIEKALQKSFKANLRDFSSRKCMIPWAYAGVPP